MSFEIVIDDDIDVVTVGKNILFANIKACFASESLIFEFLFLKLLLYLGYAFSYFIFCLVFFSYGHILFVLISLEIVLFFLLKLLKLIFHGSEA